MGLVVFSVMVRLDLKIPQQFSLFMSITDLDWIRFVVIPVCCPFKNTFSEIPVDSPGDLIVSP